MLNTQKYVQFLTYRFYGVFQWQLARINVEKLEQNENQLNLVEKENIVT